MAYPLEAQTLMKRFKRQRLSTSEKLYIFDPIANRKATLRNIASDFSFHKRQLEELFRKRWHNICINKLWNHQQEETWYNHLELKVW